MSLAEILLRRNSSFFQHNIVIPRRTTMFSEEEYQERFGFPIATRYPRLPVPKPETFDDILPEVSDEIVVTQNPAGDVSVYVSWWGGWVASSALKTWFYVQHPFPQDVRLAYSIFWRRIETHKLAAGEQLTRSVTVKNGTTVTDTNNLAAELGVSFNGLSAKLSKTVGHSVTVMTETDVTTAYQYTAKTRAVWTLWQLMERFAFVDEKGDIIDWASDAQQLKQFSGRVRLVLATPAVVSRPPQTMYPDAVEF
jgi:hypothetical protein